jgi:hypothetical protein
VWTVISKLPQGVQGCSTAPEGKEIAASLCDTAMTAIRSRFQGLPQAGLITAFSAGYAGKQTK